jgi:hypothetical protein
VGSLNFDDRFTVWAGSTRQEDSTCSPCDQGYFSSSTGKAKVFIYTSDIHEDLRNSMFETEMNPFFTIWFGSTFYVDALVQGCTLFNQKTFMIVFCMKVKKVRIMIVF